MIVREELRCDTSVRMSVCYVDESCRYLVEQPTVGEDDCCMECCCDGTVTMSKIGVPCSVTVVRMLL